MLDALSFHSLREPVEVVGSREDEAGLLRQMIADDETAWREFNRRYARLVYRCITRVTARFATVIGPDDVREIYALLCVQLLARDKHKLRSYEPERGNKLGSWIGMLAIHTAYDFLRSIKREPRRTVLSEAESLLSELPDPCEVAMMRERAEIVASVLESFSDKDREFITLYFGESLPAEQIADRMGISIKTVYSKKHKIRTRLEALLEQKRLAA